MTQKPVVHLHTSQHPTEALMAPLIQSQTGGSLVHVQPRPYAFSPAPGTLHFRGDEIEKAHVVAATAPRAVVDISSDCRHDFMRLLQDYPGTAADYEVCVLTVAPDEHSQSETIRTGKGLMAVGMAPGQMRLVRVGGRRGEPQNAPYALITQFAEEHGELEHWRSSVVLRDAVALARLHGMLVPLGELLHAKIDYQAELENAWRAGADEESRQMLMHKVLTQRMVTSMRDGIDEVFHALSLQRISPSEWVEEAARFAACARGEGTRASRDGENATVMSQGVRDTE